MTALFKMLLAPIFSLIFTILASGLFTTFVSLRLEIEGHSPALIGAVISIFYAGVLVGAFMAPTWVAKAGYSRTVIILYAVNAAAILSHAFWVEAYYWMALRFVVGVAIGGFFTVIESWFLKSSLPTMRGQALSLYLILYYASLSMGQLLLNMTNPSSLGSFCLAGALSVLAIIPIAASTSDPPPKNTPLAIQKPLQISPFGFFGGIASGMVIASIYGLVPVYAKEIRLTLEEISLFMAVIIFGGFCLQWPLGKWADLWGKKIVLVIVCYTAAILSVCIAVIQDVSFPWLLFLSWVFGGATFALYPLSMAYVCDGVEDDHLPTAAGKFISSYGIGAVAGPLLASLFISQIGMPGLFYFMALICVLLSLIPTFRK